MWIGPIEARHCALERKNIVHIELGTTVMSMRNGKGSERDGRQETSPG
jgi:hypothetical protein